MNDLDCEDGIDEIEEAMMNCHLFPGDDGYWYCGAVGSEDCDFECPFNGDIGKRWKRAAKESK